MASPKSGTAGTAVTPTDPTAPDNADVADPGAVKTIKAQQMQTKTGKYGSVKVKPFKPSKAGAGKDKKKSWIEIQMVDEQNQPVTGLWYQVTLPDGETVAEGTLNEKGLARIEGIDPGTCQITFPGLDQDAWKKA